MMLISDAYREQQEAMHRMPRGYGGVNSVAYGSDVLAIIEEENAQEVLDYGAGKGHLGEYLFRNGFKGVYIPYDPGIAYWSETPKPCEMVVCMDVLEHIEPDLLDNVLADLQRVTIKSGVFSVHSRPAKKSLPDGRNAHLTIEPPQWWQAKIAKHFTIVQWAEAFAKRDGEVCGAVYRVRRLP
jgi:2-polyprenyl-3-methyl-5-hydroxy-6-metoxy-1,4-benzoquinol methylase